jgi:hypothetical protein
MKNGLRKVSQQAPHGCPGRFSYQMLRNSYHNPTICPEASVHFSVVGAVVNHFFKPKLPICFWKPETPRAAVPKASVHKNGNFSRFSKNKIRTAGQIEVATPTLDARILKAFLKPLLCGNVSPRPDTFHYSRAFAFGKNISHKNESAGLYLSRYKPLTCNKSKFISSTSCWAAITNKRKQVITSSHVLAGVLKAFEPFGWKVHHRYDHNPALINKLGYGDRRFGKSDDEKPVYIPEPNLTLSKNGKGLIVEVDFKYSKKSFLTIETIRKTKKKSSYLKRYFGGAIPKKILYGIAIPNLTLHVTRGREHLKSLDFFLCASKSGEVYKIKAPTNADFSPLGRFKKFENKQEVVDAKK